MAFKTFGELNDELVKELDLEGEDFVDANELMRLWNRAVGVTEGHLITLGLKDKYLLARAQLSLVNGTEEYSLPTTLYGNKIIKVVYSFGATIYELVPLDAEHMFEEYEYRKRFSTTDIYKYFITHTTPGVEKFIVCPPSHETSANALTVWFSRAANRYAQDSDFCDLPSASYEFMNSYVTEKIYKKESHINFEEAKADRMEKEQLMISVLSGQIADSQMSKMELDMSAYQEST